MYTHASLRVTRERARESERGRARGQVSCRKQSNQEQSNQARSSQEQSTQSHWAPPQPEATLSQAARMQHPHRHKQREVPRRSSGAARKDSCTACKHTVFTPCHRTHSAVDTRRAHRLRLTRFPPAQQQRAPRRPPAETLQCRASTRPHPHPARADSAHTPMHATRDRPTRARVRRRPSGGVRPPGTAQPRDQEHCWSLVGVAAPLSFFRRGLNLGIL